MSNFIKKSEFEKMVEKQEEIENIKKAARDLILAIELNADFDEECNSYVNIQYIACELDTLTGLVKWKN